MQKRESPPVGNIKRKRPRLKSAVAITGTVTISALALAGCGGASTSKSTQPYIASGPAIYGYQPPVGSAAQTGETSGFGAPNYSLGYVTGAIASDAKPTYGVASQNNGTIPLGFSPGGQYIDGPVDNLMGAALAPSQSVIFAVDISNGNNASGNLIPINPSSVVLTNIPAGSPDLPAIDSGLTFSQPLHFAYPLTGGSSPTGPFSDAAYTTNTFTLPFTTTGLHGARVSVADTAGNTSYTDFYALVLAGSDSAVLVQVLGSSDPGVIPPSPIAGATVSISNALPGVTAYNPPAGEPTESVTDRWGVAIVFAAPGQQTITASYQSQTVTDTPTLVAGQVYDSVTSGQKTSPYSLTFTSAIPTFRR